MPSRLALLPTTLMTFTAVTVTAGGWVVITIQDLPHHVVAGTPVTLTYSVRQHGRVLLGGLDGRLEISQGPERLLVPVTELGHGRYSATFSVPRAGIWTIEVRSGFSGPLNSSTITLPAVDGTTPVPPVSKSERGRQLFTGKGCITCHAHEIGGNGQGAGSARTSQPGGSSLLQLKQFLARPAQTASAKFGEEMPDLDLSENENCRAGGVHQRQRWKERLGLIEGWCPASALVDEDGSVLHHDDDVP